MSMDRMVASGHRLVKRMGLRPHVVSIEPRSAKKMGLRPHVIQDAANDAMFEKRMVL